MRTTVERSLPCILAVCGDPGGANAVATVLEEIDRTGVASIIALGYRDASHLWKKRGISCENLPDKSTDRSIREILKKRNPSLLLTGTSFNSVNLEKKFIAAARDLNIPSLTILDFWSNYRVRFSDDQNRLAFVPDIIAVMDEVAFSDMVAEGFDPRRLVITGQPLFDDLVACRKKFSHATREKIRTLLKIPDTTVVVMFASQPISTLFGTDSTNPLFPGYTEQTVLRSLISTLEQINRSESREIALVIRPHPRENSADYAQFTSAKIRIKVSDTSDTREIAFASDLVTGMSSIVLVEAVYLGCRVVSIQPGLRFKDSLPTNSSGRSKAVYSESDLLPEIQKALNELPQTENSTRNGGTAASGRTDGRSAQRVLEQILLLIDAKNKEIT